MERKKTMTRTRSVLISLAVVMLVALGLSSLNLSTSAQKGGGGTKISADLDQVRNGSFTSPDDPPDWVNGNAGASNAHYREAQSIPYRLKLTGYAVGNHSVFIEYDVKHSGRFAIDYITHYDRIPETVIPCGAPNHPEDIIPTCEPGSEFTIPPPDTNAPALNQPVPGGFPQPTTSFNNLPLPQRQFTSYNATVTGISYVGTPPDYTASQTKQMLRIDFTVLEAGRTVVLAWGGHIASRLDWGTDANGVPRSAAGISGSPYHTRLISFCNGPATNSNDSNCSGGNQDRSLSAAAVLPQAGCGIEPAGAKCVGAETTYSSPGTDPAATFLWKISGDGVFLVSGSETTNDQTTSTVVVRAKAGATGSYTLDLTTNGAGFTEENCSLVVQVNPNPDVFISTNMACPGVPTLTADLSNNVDQNPANYTFSWTGPMGFTANTQTIMPTVTGDYFVTVTRNGCTSAQASGRLCYAFGAIPTP